MENIKSERGAIIIEATLSLTMFMFAMLTIYSMFHVSLAQARIGTALNATAKEISQYAYVYDLTALNSQQANLAANGGAAQSVLSDNLSQVNSIYTALKGISSGTAAIAGSPGNTESFLYYVLNQGIDAAKGGITGELARMLMRKHFGSDPDKFLQGLGVENGMKGLSFRKSRIFSNGTESDVLLDVRYQVTVIKLLNIDLKLNFELCAKTRAWVGSD